MLSRKSSTSRSRMAVAFTAGMVITAVLAQVTPFADTRFPQLIHEPVIPAQQDAADTLKPGSIPEGIKPVKPGMYEMVYGPAGEAELLG